VTGWAWAAIMLGYVIVAALTARLFIRADLDRAARHALNDRRGAARYVKPGCRTLRSASDGHPSRAH
jgi:hypothetical protein